MALLTTVAAALMAAGTAASDAPAAGMYALSWSFPAGGTCNNEQSIFLGSLDFRGAGNAGSTAYYLQNPGSEADTVSFPVSPESNGGKWRGSILWATNPWSFEPPPVKTRIDATITYANAKVFFLNGTIIFPTSDGGKCSSNFNMTALFTGRE